MARPVVGDVRVKIENRPQKNGCIYVYERQVRYDPESRTNKTLSRKLRGIKYPGSDTIVETRSKRKPDVEVKTVDSEGKHVILRKKIGCLSLLEWVGLDSGIDQDIKTAFGEDNELALRCINECGAESPKNALGIVAKLLVFLKPSDYVCIIPIRFNTFEIYCFNFLIRNLD